MTRYSRRPQRPRFYASPRFGVVRKDGQPGTWGPDAKICASRAEAVEALVAAGVPGEVRTWSEREKTQIPVALVYADGTVVDPRPAEGWGEKYGLTYEEYLDGQRRIRHAWAEHVRAFPRPDAYPAVPGFSEACPKCQLHGHDPARCQGCVRCGGPEQCTCKRK